MEFLLESHSDSPKMGMGHQKSPVRCVWGNRNRLTRRTVTPFAFADSYGPKDVCESLYWYLKSSQKIFARLQSQTTHPPKTHFTSLYPQNGYQTPKMHSQMRFEAQQSRDVGWSPRLLFQIGLALRMFARNYNAISSCLKNFLKHFEVLWLISQNGIFAWVLLWQP